MSQYRRPQVNLVLRELMFGTGEAEVRHKDSVLIELLKTAVEGRKIMKIQQRDRGLSISDLICKNKYS